MLPTRGCLRRKPFGRAQKLRIDNRLLERGKPCKLWKRYRLFSPLILPYNSMSRIRLLILWSLRHWNHVGRRRFLDFIDSDLLGLSLFVPMNNGRRCTFLKLKSRFVGLGLHVTGFPGSFSHIRLQYPRQIYPILGLLIILY